MVVPQDSGMASGVPAALRRQCLHSYSLSSSYYCQFFPLLFIYLYQSMCYCLNKYKNTDIWKTENSVVSWVDFFVCFWFFPLLSFFSRKAEDCCPNAQPAWAGFSGELWLRRGPCARESKDSLYSGFDWGFRRTAGQYKLKEALAAPLLLSLSGCSYFSSFHQ